MTDRGSMFDAKAFGAVVLKKMRDERWSCRTLSDEIGVSKATIQRVSNGAAPDIETFMRLTTWIGWQWALPREKQRVSMEGRKDG